MADRNQQSDPNDDSVRGGLTDEQIRGVGSDEEEFDEADDMDDEDEEDEDEEGTF